MTIDMQVGARPTADRLAAAPGRRFGLVAGILLVVSALLQSAAAAQRWMFADRALIGSDRTIEDHLFDYVIPADPWVSVGGAATLFGVGYLLIGAALVSVGAAARATGKRIRGVMAVATAAAAPFVFLGLHALASGVIGVSSPLQYLTAPYGALIVGVIQMIMLIVLAVMLARRSWAWAIGVLTLIGATLVGYVWAVFTVAPMLVGYQSYDTTPWTEGVLAAATAAAAVALLIGCLRLRAPAVV